MNFTTSLFGLFKLSNIFDFFIDIINLIPKFVYFLTATVMGLMDIAQMMIRKLAGLDVHYVAGGETAQTGDIVSSFIRGIFDSNSQFPALKNAFWSLIILAIILLVVTTIIATIRQEYMPGAEEAKQKPSNTKTLVISRAVKSLFMFLIVPVSVLFGLLLSDILLVALDAATVSTLSDSSLLGASEVKVEGDQQVTYRATDKLVAENVGASDDGTSSYIYYDFFGHGMATTGLPISGITFKVSGFMSNRVRIGKEYKNNQLGEGDPDGLKSFYQLVKAGKQEGGVSNFGIFNMANDATEMAQMIDEAFAGNVRLSLPEDLFFEGSAAYKDIKNPMVFPNSTIDSFSKYNVALVWYFYDLWQYNFVIAFAFLIVGLKLLVKIVVGLMKRIIEMVALFLISPPIIALMPLDSGKAFNQWRKSFIGKALSAFGAIVGMNLLFLLLPYLQQIKFIPETVSNVVGGVDVYKNGAIMINLIIGTLFVLVGLTVVESFIALIGSYIGADDVAKEGGELVGKVGDTLGESLTRVSSAAGFATKAVTSPFKLGARALGIGGGSGDGKSKPPKPMKRKLTDKDKEDISSSTRDTWNTDDPSDENGGGANSSYIDYLNSNNDFQTKMRSEYEKRDKGESDLSYDNWRLHESGAKARMQVSEELSKDNVVQSFEDFKKAESGAGAEYLQKNVDKNISDSSYYSEEEANTIRTKRREAFKNNPFVKGAGAISNEALKVGKQLSGFASQIGSVVDDSFEGKLNMKTLQSMQQAFQGLSKKDIEKIKKKEDIYKEEKMRKGFYDSKGEPDSKNPNQSRIEREKEIKDILDEQTKALREDIKQQSEEITKLKNKK
jgi:hypothetical protein